MKYLLFTAFSLLILTSCLPESRDKIIDNFRERDEATIAQLNNEQQLGLTRSESGLYYRLDKALPEAREIDSSVEVLIAYKLSNFEGDSILGSSPEDSTVINFFRDQAISGFYAALDLMKEGEKATFYVPSTLAYQDQPIAGIQEWEPVILEIEVLAIFNEIEQIDYYYTRNGIKQDTLYADGISAHFINVLADTLGTPTTNFSSVIVNYEASFLNESVFDSGTLEVDFEDETILSGFRESIKKMKISESYFFLFTSDLGYGETGFGNTIPPYSPLRFRIDVVEGN